MSHLTFGPSDLQFEKPRKIIDRPISVSEPEVRDADDLHGVAAQLRHLHAAALLPAVEEQTRGQGCWISSIFILIHEDDFFRYVDW